METFLNKKQENRGVNKAFIIALIGAAVAIGAAIWLLSLKPSMDEQMAKILEGSYREGSPERTIESPTAFGTISMYINGTIRNKGTKTINGLEVNVAVVDQFNQVLREKRILVVPVQQSVLAPGQTIPITLTLDGFSKDDDRANIRWKVTAIRTQ
jgi:hypothetical protein